jgi:hypothetical protein
MYGVGGGKWLQEKYEEATDKPHSYLMIDGRQETPNGLRLRTNICPDPGTTSVVHIPPKFRQSVESLIFHDDEVNEEQNRFEAYDKVLVS